MKKTIIVANWKMNPQTLKEAESLFDSVKEGIKNSERVEVVICPPFTYLPALLKNPKALIIGAQNSFWEDSGAFTGEISPLMLKSLGCQYVILGHSERRKYFSEKDEEVNQKIKAVVSADLKPILCIGESQGEREKGDTQNVLERQLRKALYDIPSQSFQNSEFLIAYEPIWAIGTGKACSSEEAEKVAVFIRKTLTDLCDKETAEEVPILYGGSANSQNAQSYIKEVNLRGLLVGGASLKAEEFIKIIEIVVEK